jgi:hypothetical protein
MDAGEVRLVLLESDVLVQAVGILPAGQGPLPPYFAGP